MAIKVARRLNSNDVLDILAELFFRKGTPFTLGATTGASSPKRSCITGLKSLGVETLFIELGSPLENGYIESSTGKLHDEIIRNRESFDTLAEAKAIIGAWRRE